MVPIPLLKVKIPIIKGKKRWKKDFFNIWYETLWIYSGLEERTSMQRWSCSMSKSSCSILLSYFCFCYTLSFVFHLAFLVRSILRFEHMDAPCLVVIANHLESILMILPHQGASYNFLPFLLCAYMMIPCLHGVATKVIKLPGLLAYKLLVY